MQKELPLTDATRLSTTQALEDEVHQLKRQLKSFMRNVRVNEEKLRRLQGLELRLIRAMSLADFFDIILKEYRETAQLDEVSLVLLDPTFELRKIAEEERLESRHPGKLLFVERRSDLEERYSLRPQPYVGPYRAERHKALFGKKHQDIASVAVIPLYQQHQLAGSLNLGSARTERYIEGSATDLLQRFCEILIACLGNVLNAERLKRLGLTDPLTGVNNRRFFDQRLFEEVGQSQRNRQPLCCLFFDVDHFKRVNDRYGHETGDIVLREVASIIRMNLRAADVLSRYGGEEFSALLLNSNAHKAKEIAERIRRSVESTQFNVGDGKTLKISISIGIAVLEKHPNPNAQIDTEQLATDLVNKADEFLYHAKNSGRNKAVIGDLFDALPVLEPEKPKEKGDAERQHRLF